MEKSYLDQTAEEWKMLHGVLANDVLQATDELRKEPTNQFKRRAVFHFIFVLVEGLIFRMKQATLEIHNAGRSKFSEAQIAILKEENYGLNRRGDAVPERKFFRLEDNIKFSFKAYASVWNVVFDLNLGNDPRWDSFLKAISTRNRITHPKKMEDMQLSDEDMDHVHKSFIWFVEQIERLFNTCSSSRNSNC